ncbi:MAG: SpoIIE family protein phosphatase [Eubacteriales bacterium]
MTDEKIKKNAGSPSFLRIEKRRKNIRKSRIRSALYTLAAVLCGFMFSGTKLPFDTYPLGLAFVCASGKYALQALVGVFIRLAFFRDGASFYLTAIMCAVSVLLRYLAGFAVRKKENIPLPATASLSEKLAIRDDISFRVLIASGAYIVVAVWRIISLGTFYGVFAGIFGVLASSLFTFLFSFAGDIKYKDTGASSAGRAALVFCAVLSCSDIRVFTISVGLVVAYMITLFAGYTGEGARGAVTGLLVGLACGGDFAVLFAFAGLAAGVFYELSPVVASLVSVGITVCGGLYTLGTENLISFLPEIIIAAVIVTTAGILDILPSISFSENKAEGELCMRELLAKKRETEKELRATSRADMLSSLSGIIKNMSENFRRPERDVLSGMCREVFDEICADCPMSDACRSARSRGLDMIESITDRLMGNGKLGTDKCAELSKVGCGRSELIISAINARATRLFEEAYSRDKTRIFAFDYEAASKIIADTVSRGDAGYEVDRVMSERLAKAFSRAGVSAENLVVCGDRKKYIIATGKELLRCDKGAEDIKKLCETICGGSFTLPEYVINSDNAAMTVESTRVFEVEYAGRQSAKRGERVCGDAIGVTESRDDFFYGFICDGMGSGENADLTARICKTFLEKMLSCGNKKSTTLDMLNMFISNKNTECFSTVDLLEIDLMRGVASFTKSGAAASYIVRRGSVYKIASGTMPIGILPDVSAEVTEFSLCDGDVIVMCSDGVCHDPENDDTDSGMRLIDLLENEWSTDINRIAENIISDSVYSGKRADDMSVGVFRIRKRKNVALYEPEPSSEADEKSPLRAS